MVNKSIRQNPEFALDLTLALVCTQIISFMDLSSKMSLKYNDKAVMCVLETVRLRPTYQPQLAAVMIQS